MNSNTELERLDEELAFKILVDGKEVICYIILIFDNKETGKQYVVYTDGTKNSDGTLEILASTYSVVDKEIRLGEITTDAEWDMVDEMLARVGGTDE